MHNDIYIIIRLDIIQTNEPYACPLVFQYFHELPNSLTWHVLLVVQIVMVLDFTIKAIDVLFRKRWIQYILRRWTTMSNMS